jgi:hypothetical protein
MSVTGIKPRRIDSFQLRERLRPLGVAFSAVPEEKPTMYLKERIDGGQ